MEQIPKIGCVPYAFHAFQSSRNRGTDDFGRTLVANRPPRWCQRCRASHGPVCPQRVRPVDRRPDSTARGYDATWERLSRMVRLASPICAHCHEAAATEVDHIVPLRAGGARLELSNLQALCHPCHTAKTRRDRELYQF